MEEVKDIVSLTLTLGWKNEKRPSGPTELDLEAGNLVALINNKCSLIKHSSAYLGLILRYETLTLGQLTKFCFKSSLRNELLVLNSSTFIFKSYFLNYDRICFILMT